MTSPASMETLEEGDGAHFPSPGCRVRVHYTGKWIRRDTRAASEINGQGNKIGIDPGGGPTGVNRAAKLVGADGLSTSTVAEGPYEFVLGKGETVKCFEVAVLKMSVGQKVRVTCKPSDAYGLRGFPPFVPPNSIVVFLIKLLTFDRKPPSKAEEC